MRAGRKILPLGRMVAPPGALHVLARAGENALLYLARHASGDWGEVCPDDAHANELARETGERILSAYRLRDHTKLWIITEADRSSTCILLPEEYLFPWPRGETARGFFFSGAALAGCGS